MGSVSVPAFLSTGGTPARGCSSSNWRTRRVVCPYLYFIQRRHAIVKTRLLYNRVFKTYVLVFVKFCSFLLFLHQNLFKLQITQYMNDNKLSYNPESLPGIDSVEIIIFQAINCVYNIKKISASSAMKIADF
jgi:hypothetical protein